MGGVETLSSVTANYTGATTIGSAVGGPAATLAVTGATSFASSISPSMRPGTFDLTGAGRPPR